MYNNCAVYFSIRLHVYKAHFIKTAVFWHGMVCGVVDGQYVSATPATSVFRV
jgi:hypothetical protein